MLQPGTELKRGYQVERVLGQGGMGAVYLARQSSLGRLVAVKETRVDIDDPQIRAAALESFQKEAEILASLDHPHLVDVKDYFEEGASHFLVMSYIDGATLEDVIADAQAPLPVGQVLEWVDQICDVLQFLHEHRPPVLVRDLKPSNVMVDARGRIKLIDFGIARFSEGGSQTSTYLKGAGTLGFAPIEQFGSGSTDERSDIYALGATMYCMLTRKVPPWSMQMATGEVCLAPPSSLNPDIPASVERIILKAMALRRDDRFQTVALMRKALLDAAAEVPAGPRVATADVGQRFCTHCGTTLLPASVGCDRCGTPRLLDTGGAGAFQPAAPVAILPNVPSVAGNGTPLPSAGASGGFHVPQEMPLSPPPRQILIGMALALLVAVALVAGIVLLVRERAGSGTGVIASGTVEPGPASATPAGRPARLGIELKTPSLRERRRLRLGAGPGVIVTRVDPHGPAAAALAAQDVIVAVDGVAVRTVDEFERQLALHRSGDAVSLQLWTGAAPRPVSVTAE